MAAAAAESYIGSLISLTSKSEIRYEGVLYSINTEESSIGLRNVRSFGTEGRKKDGQQIPASDKVYEYILFRGSDIKDLQVKSSPPAQPASLHNDPAIIQSHFPRPASTPTPSAASGTAADLSSQNAQLATQRPPFPGNVPLYPPGASLPSWNTSPAPPSANGTGMALPAMYWQGYYAQPSGFPHLQQPPFLRPPPAMAVPQSLQQPVQYPGLNASLPAGFPGMPELPSVLQPGSANLSLSSGTSTSVPAPTLSSSSAPESSASQLPNNPSANSISAPSMGSTSLVSPLNSNTEASVSMSKSTPSLGNRKPVAVPGPSTPSLGSNKHVSAPVPALAYQSLSQPPSTNSLPISLPVSTNTLSSIVSVEASIPLVTPGQFLPTTLASVLSSQPLQTAPSTAQPLQPASSTVLSSHTLQMSHEDREAKQPESKTKPLLPEPPVLAPSEKKEPLLPAQKPILQQPVGASSYAQSNNRGRGRGRGRGNGYSRTVTKFTEDFDFTAMNEKFNKDEVWGHLGKSKAQLVDDPNGHEDYDFPEDDEVAPAKLESTPVYVKDDFFDSLSCNTIRGGRNGRTKFSEQMKIDTETFGEFSRHRPMGTRGGWRGFRGGGPRGRGSYYGRGYGYMGKGRGYSYPNHQS